MSSAQVEVRYKDLYSEWFDHPMTDDDVALIIARCFQAEAKQAPFPVPIKEIVETPFGFIIVTPAGTKYNVLVEVTK